MSDAERAESKKRGQDRNFAICFPPCDALGHMLGPIQKHEALLDLLKAMNYLGRLGGLL